MRAKLRWDAVRAGVSVSGPDGTALGDLFLIRVPTAGFAGARARFEDNPVAGAAVHHDSNGFLELQVADAALLFYRRLFVQPPPIYSAFTGIGIHGEITYLEGGQVLEEMAALRGSHPEIAEPGLDDHTRAGDFVPFHRNAEPRFGRSPAADADQQVRTILFVELAIQAGYGSGYLLAAAALEALRIDHHDVVKIVDASIAQNFTALADQLIGFNVV